MCVGNEDKPQEAAGPERRSFLTGVSLAVSGAVLGGDAAAQQTPQPPSPALDDPSVVQGMVSFRSGTATLQGYLARPKAAGRYRSVVVLHGDFGLPLVDRYTAAVLAQNGFASLALQRFSRYPELTVQDVIKSDRTDRRYLSRAFNQEELQDAQAAIDYLKSQSFVRRGGAGVVGFCGGGVQGLWLSTQSRDVKAVVTLYAPTGESDQHQDPNDPKPSVLDLAKLMQAPVQGHYGTADPVTPLEDVRRFEQALQARDIPLETFFYEGAKHAFCNYERPNYDAAACKLALSRMLTFLKSRL